MSGLIVHVKHGVFVACVGRFINGMGSGIAQASLKVFGVNRNCFRLLVWL